MGNMGTAPTAQDRHRAAVISGARALADLLERYPDLPVPPPSFDVVGPPHIVAWLMNGSAGDVRERFVDVARILGVSPRLSYDRTGVQLQARLGAPNEPTGGLTYGVYASARDLFDALDRDEQVTKLAAEIGFDAAVQS